MTKTLYILFFLILFSAHHSIQAQATLEVAAKTIEKQLPYNSTGIIIVNGENATIKIDSWNRNEIKIKIKIIAKHRIKTVAISELDNIKYLIKKKGGDIYIRNYFLLKEESTIGCILKVEYELTVPAKSNFNIKNNLGNIEIKNTEGKLDIEAKFGNINLYNTKGAIGINLSLGDIQANKMDGRVSIKANNSEITMENLSGKYHLKLLSSDVFFKPINPIELLNIETKNGDVNLQLPPNNSYNYILTTSYGEIKVPDIFKAGVIKEKNKTALKYFPKNVNSSIYITSNFGNITVSNNLIIK